MVGAQTAVIRTAVMHFGIEFQRHFRLLVVVSDLAVVFHIIGYHHLRIAVGCAVFEHPNLIVLKNNFSINGANIPDKGFWYNRSKYNLYWA